MTDYCSTTAPSSGGYRFSQLHVQSRYISSLQVICTLLVIDVESCAYLCIRSNHHITGLHCTGVYYTVVSSVCGLISSTITNRHVINTKAVSNTDYITALLYTLLDCYTH